MNIAMDKKTSKALEYSSDQSVEGETVRSTELEEPFVKKFAGVPGEQELPCIENDYSRAKAYLMKQCLNNGDNLWEHLNEVLQKILMERPKDIGCTFEEFSYRVRESRFKSKTDHLVDIFEPPKQLLTAQRLLELIQPQTEENLPEKTDDEEEEKAEPNIMECFNYFEQGGVCLPKDEVFTLGVHLRKLISEHPIEKCRFWGKILGTSFDYYIAEAELNEEEISKINAENAEEEERVRLEQLEREAAEEEQLRLKKEADLEEARQRELKLAEERSSAKHKEMVKKAKALGLPDIPVIEELPPWPPILPPPVPVVKKTVKVPIEPIGTGVNKKVYFVCTRPGEKWIQLPNVTPEEIVLARKIKRSFQGDLESTVTTYPSFPGKEKNLLRAQIARISAGTHISPLGYYTFNEEEEEEEMEVEAGEPKSNYAINPDYEPVGIRDLTDASMAFWVHHTQYILEQGRTVWWNPAVKEVHPDEEEGEAEEEEETGKEIGPELLTPLSEDSCMDAVVPWSVRKTSTYYPENSIAIVRSNLWPGAYAFAADKKFGNVYIGYGLKFTTRNHSPIPMPPVQDEYPTGPEIMEILDPTPEQEEFWRLAHEPKEVEEEEEYPPEDDTNADDEDDE